MPHRQLAILLVDDQTDMRESLARRLQHDAFHVATADNGEQALDMMRIERFDVALLALQMPGGGGYETLLRIKADPVLSKTNVLMLTVAKEREAVLRCLQAGAVDYLVKPCDFREMKTRIWRVALARGLVDSKHDDAGVIDTAKAQVLVVDDQGLSRDLLSRRVQALGHRATSVASGEEALTRLKSEPIDLVLLDIQMPGMDGFAVLSAIRTDERLCDTAVMLVSAHNDSATIARGYELGADDYITKPYSSVELEARMTICLAVRRAERERRERLGAPAKEGANLGFHGNAPKASDAPRPPGDAAESNSGG